MAALYHERWEIENALDELKTHLRGSRIVLRSKTPELVEQEFYGLMMAHFAIRGLMHEAAIRADIDPDELFFCSALVRNELSSVQNAQNLGSYILVAATPRWASVVKRNSDISPLRRCAEDAEKIK